MAQKTIAGQTIEVNDEGYMVNASQWTKEIAAEMKYWNSFVMLMKRVRPLRSEGLENLVLWISKVYTSFFPVVL